MEKAIFNKFVKIVYEKSGIALKPGKEALVSARVAKRIRALGIEHGDFATYLRYLSQDKSGEEIVHLLDAISTNVTSFYRETHHFELLTQLASKWLENGQRKFRFWSAGCSSGEEPYSMAITLKEVSEGHNCDIRILATDISTKVIDKAMLGAYQAKKLETVPPMLKHKYFTKEKTADGALYHVKDELKRMIVYKRLNLATPPFPMRGPMDVVFCRNVMIYFDNVVRRNLLCEIYRLVKPGGYLFVGHSESLTGIVSDFKTVRPATYIKPG